MEEPDAMSTVPLLAFDDDTEADKTEIAPELAAGPEPLSRRRAPPTLPGWEEVLRPPASETSPPRVEADSPPRIVTRAAGRDALPEDPATTETFPAAPRVDPPL